MFKINIVTEDLRWKKEVPMIEKILKKNLTNILPVGQLLFLHYDYLQYKDLQVLKI